MLFYITILLFSTYTGKEMSKEVIQSIAATLTLKLVYIFPLIGSAVLEYTMQDNV